MKSFKKSVLMFTALSLTLTACAGIDAGKTVDGAENRADQALASIGTEGVMRSGGVQVNEGVYMASSRQTVSSGANLPRRWQTAGAVTITSREPMTLGEILLKLAEITTIQHVAQFGDSGLAVSSSGGETADGASARVASAGAGGQRMAVNFRGTLPEILNQVANHFQLEWSYEANRVIFRDFVTRQYQISALPATQTGSAAVGTVSTNMSNDVMKDIIEGLTNLVSKSTRITIGTSTGTITVSGSVADQAVVRKYLDEVNGNLNKQIAFDVNVLTVSLNNDRSAGLDIASAIRATGAGSGAANSIGLGANYGSVNIGVIEGDVNMSALVKALSAQGKVSVDTRTGVRTANNRIVPVEVVDEISYVASIDIETDDDGNERYVPKPETEDIGFKMQLFPRVLNAREIMVQYSVNISELNELATFGTGSSQVQLPNISQTSFDQQAILRSGQTLVLAGFDRNRAEVNSTAGLMTAGKAVKMDRVSTVIMITPRLLGRTTPVLPR